MRNKMSPTGRILWPALLALAASVLPGDARADWLLPRGNARRTGTAAGVSNLQNPVPYWRHYLGGAISTTGALLLDVDGDGQGEMVLVSGGKVVAKEWDDRMIWATPVLGMSELVAARDLDGDGQEEVVARSLKQVFVIEPATGRMLWTEPADDFGYLGGARVGDLDMDGIDDLLVQECGCCRVNNGNTGFMYSFAAGFDAPVEAQRQWTMGSVRCGGNKSMTILDMNGDGRAEVTEGWSDGIAVVDGATGTELAPRAVLGPRSAESQCLAVDTDKNGTDELLCLQNNGPADDPDAAHRLYVIEYVAGDAGQGTVPELRVRWQQAVGEVARRVAMGARPVADLDGDGVFEVVVSGVAGERWMTYVFDAAAGTLLAEIGDQEIVGVVDPGGTGGALVLTRQEQDLYAWAFRRDANEPVQALWSLPGHRVMIEPDRDTGARMSVAGRVAAGDLNGDGVRELLLVNERGLVGYDVSKNVPAVVAEMGLDGSVSMLAAWVTGNGVVVALSSGVMHVLDGALVAGTRGLRFGGYYPKGDWRNLHVTPVIGDLGGGADSVIMSDSRGALLRIDGKNASLAVPPAIAWSRPDTTGPSLVPGPDGTEIVCRERQGDGTHRVVVLDTDGKALRSAAVGGQLLSDIVPARLDDDGVTDFVIQWGAAGDLTLRHRGYSGATLAPLWDAASQYKGTTRFPAGGTVLDWNGDGTDDFVHQYYTTEVLSGVDGALLAESGTNGVYFMPIAADVNGDMEEELILQAGFNPVAVVDRNFAPLWASSDDDRPYPYGSLITSCADQVPRLVEGSVRYPARLKITEVGGVATGRFTTLVLADGRGFASEEEAAAAGVFMGQLTSTSAHANLSGDGRAMAVVGSEDGWLYAVDGCTGELGFAVKFDAAVGAIGFGDTDGDGMDEILVAVGDGYLYALKEAPVDAPGWVIDTDPPGVVDVDVDRIATGASMSAAWQGVTGARGYEVAIIHTETGVMVSPWQEVGNVTGTTVTGLALSEGEQYTFVVRALAGAGPSPDAWSDGVVVELPEPLAGYPVGCTCNGQGRGWPGMLVLAGAVLILLLGRGASRARD